MLTFLYFYWGTGNMPSFQNSVRINTQWGATDGPPLETDLNINLTANCLNLRKSPKQKMHRSTSLETHVGTFANIWLGGKSLYLLLTFISVTGGNPHPKTKLKLTLGDPVPKALRQASHTAQKVRVTPLCAPPSLSRIFLGQPQRAESQRKGKSLKNHCKWQYFFLYICNT